MARVIASQHPGDQISIIPACAFLSFPPFPSSPVNVNLTPLSDWKASGVWIVASNGRSEEREAPVAAHSDQESSGAACPLPHDAHGVPLTILDSSTPEGDILALEAKAKAKKSMKLANSKLVVRVEKEDCWKIGEEGVDWDEPNGTSRSSFDISIPPFTRLLSATNDFYHSRLEEFQFKRSKCLFDLVRREHYNTMRNAFGLRTDFAGKHWPGNYPDTTRNGSEEQGSAIPGLSEETPSSSSETGEITFKQAAVTPDSPEEEACVLLTKMEMSVRGFLAPARREAEAGWDFKPAFHLAQITAAFMSFVRHYGVLSEPKLHNAVDTATQLARKAPQQIIDAKQLEDVLCAGHGWNRAAWTTWGCTFGGPERCGLAKELLPWGLSEQYDETREEDDGGWVVDPVIDNRPMASTANGVRPYLTALAYPLSVDEVTLLQYLPYARRRISAVLPPLPPSPNRSTYAHKLHRIVTVPAPSTSEEKWRVYSRQFDGNSAEEDDNQSGIYEDDARRFEAEDATVKEPEELVIWVEGEISDSQMDLKRFVGIGLQGRWAMMGTGSAGEGANQWWSFEAKDSVLPAFWQSESIRSGDANLA